MTLNEAKYAALLTLTGESGGTLNGLEYLWLSTETGETGTLNELWLKFLEGEGFTDGTLNGRQMAWLGSLGYTGTWNERMLQYWAAGGGGGSTLVFHAFDDVGGGFVADVIVGNGSVVDDSGSTRYYPDDAGVYQAYGAGVPGEVYRDGKWWVICQPAAVNLQTYSNDLTDATWTATDVTVARDAAGMTGAVNTACTLTATADDGSVMSSAITAASSDFSTRWFIQRVSGAGTIEITVNNGTNWEDVTSVVDGSTDLWPECIESFTLANPQCGIRLGTSGDVVVVGNAECFDATEPEVVGGSPIFTSDSTADVEPSGSLFLGSNHDNAQGGWYFEYLSVASQENNSILMSLNNGLVTATPAHMSTTTNLRSRASSGTAANQTVSITPGVAYKIGCAYETADGGSLANAFDGSWSSTQTGFPGFLTSAVIRAPVTAQNEQTVLYRNFRRYDESFADAKATISGLMA